MVRYVLCRSLANLPKPKEIKAFIYDSSLAKRPYTGWGFLRKGHRPYWLMINWPKWKDNPNCPTYTAYTGLDVAIFPYVRSFKGRRKRIEAIARSHGYGAILQVYLGYPDGNGMPRPAVVDQRAFHRLVLFLGERLHGVVLDNLTGKLMRPDEYHKEYRRLIDLPFHLHLTERDLKRLPSGAKSF